MSSNQNIKFEAKDISKSFFRKNFIFSGIDISLDAGDTLAIVGRNGSGKSTLMKIFANLMLPTSGGVNYFVNGVELKPNTIPGKIAFVAPYINLYEEFTPLELAEIYCGISGNKLDLKRFQHLADEFNLSSQSTKVIKNFSSGMKQRVKLILGFLSNPKFLFLDEPGTNLDIYGIETAIRLAKLRAEDGLITFIASNDEQETNHSTKYIEV